MPALIQPLRHDSRADAAAHPRPTRNASRSSHRRGYRFIAPVEPAGLNATPRASSHVNTERMTAIAVPEKTRIAVLPFVNLSQDPDQEYFSDGLTEEMIAQLSRVRPERLSVIARTSAARFKRSGRSIDEIGRELRVAYVVEGAVRQSGGRVRITTQLVDATDQTNLMWPQRCVWNSARSRIQVLHKSWAPSCRLEGLQLCQRGVAMYCASVSYRAGMGKGASARRSKRSRFREVKDRAAARPLHGLLGAVPS